MPDQLTMLENKLDAAYTNSLDVIAQRYGVTDWADYHFRIGYLRAIRDLGKMIKEVRNPELAQDTGEIPSILEEMKDV